MKIIKNQEINDLKFPEFIDHNEPILPISIIARILEVHQRTLRIYDEEQILCPSKTKKNHRLYSLNDVEKGKFIQYLTRNLGINLTGVKIIYSLLSKSGIKLSEFVPHLQKIAKSLNITEEEQNLTRKKLMKRGRKPKNAK